MGDGLLRFHVREVAADLALAAGALEQAARIIPDRPGVTAARLSEAISLLRHDLDHHIPEIGRIVGASTPGKPAATTEPVDTAAISTELTALAARLRAISVNSELPELSGPISRLWSSVKAALLQLSSLEKSVAQAADDFDADAARRRRDDELLAVPERTLTHKNPRALATCPHCGAALTSDDRTRDGAYCENCRTRWVPSKN
ncbi:hypothetical protein [Amycolatopsis balhimycina]|nr:hypothetical protein [Amycolatopsis balhimycina]